MDFAQNAYKVLIVSSCLSVCNFQRIILLYQILYLIRHLVINHTNLVDFILIFHLESGIKISFLICCHTIH